MTEDSSQRKPPSAPSSGESVAGSGPREVPTLDALDRESGPGSHDQVPAAAGKLKVATVLPSSSVHDVEPEYIGEDLPLPPPDPYIGCTIDGRYKVEKVLGEGGMGVVYQCRHKIIDKRVAMKVLRADMARDTEVTERFLIEAKAASAIGNQHIIDISDFGQLPDGSTYFVMEFLDGEPLTNIVDAGEPVPVERIVHIARQMAEGLSVAHASDIVHRDLKPDNVFLVTRGKSSDFVKILDFGIAKVSTTATGKLTRAGSVFGTPHYMSPEQAAGAPVDHRTDIYSLGVMLYEMASGKVPFDADNFMGILTQHMYKAPVPIRNIIPEPQDVPPGLEAIVLKCLSKRPEQRYQDMDELIADLDKLLEGLVPTAVNEMMARSGGFNVPADFFKTNTKGMPAPVPASPGGIPRNRWPLYAGIAGVCASLGIVIAIFAKSSSSDAAEQPTTAVTAPVTTAEALKTPEPEVQPVEELDVSRQVLIAVEPLDAHVFVGDEDLGASPVEIDVKDGKTVEAEIRRDGFVTRKVKIDGSDPKLSVKLRRIGGRAIARPVPKPQTKPAVRPTGPKPKPKPKIGGGEIVNPWN